MQSDLARSEIPELKVPEMDSPVENSTIPVNPMRKILPNSTNSKLRALSKDAYLSNLHPTLGISIWKLDLTTRFDKKIDN